ncbi:MAG: PAS domain S-box protein, partial [Deltaproteobacteria bacterium]|nr:PAS domain S-box protein [Deltaproteobacteria bacterium]
MSTHKVNGCVQSQPAILSADYAAIYNSVVEAAADMILVASPDGKIEYVNPAFTAVTGYRADEVIGQNPRILSSGCHSSEFYRDIWQDILSGKTWNGEIINRKKDNTLYPEEMSITPVLDEKGSIKHFVAIKRDVSKKKAMEAQLMHAQKLESVGRLAAGVAHEMNTPVQYVRDNVVFVKNKFNLLVRLFEMYDQFERHVADLGDLEECRAGIRETKETIDIDYLVWEIPLALEQTLEGLNSVIQILWSMKEFSHPGTMVKQPVDINSVLRSTAKVSTNEWKYVAELRLELDATLSKIMAYPGHLNHAFLNIIVNAAQAIADVTQNGQKGRGSITISTKKRKGGVEIRISDTGGGIPDDIGQKIFDPFFTTKDVGSGTGQGLSMVYTTIVERHGGSIDYES